MATYEYPNLILNEDLPHTDCFNKDPSQLDIEFRDYERDSFSVCGFNIRSCRRNFSSFVSFLSLLMFRFSIIVLCETWLSENIDYSFDIPGYNSVNLYRNCNGGGLKLFYDTIYSVSVIDSLTFINNVFEILSVTLNGPNIKVTICSIYRPPNSDPYLFIDQLINNVISKFNVGDKIIIIGDLNLNLYNPLNLRYIDEFINSLLSLTFFPIITLPTRIDERNSLNKHSLIDHTYLVQL